MLIALLQVIWNGLTSFYMTVVLVISAVCLLVTVFYVAVFICFIVVWTALILALLCYITIALVVLAFTCARYNLLKNLKR